MATDILHVLSAANPDARCELFYKTPYQLLVSVVLSAQTTDKMVNKVMTPIYKAGFTPQKAVSLGHQGLLEKIRTIGLAPTKAKNTVKLSQMILDLHNGDIPRTREDLEALPGVGRKTANVILGEIFGEPTIAVDTHVYRVTARLGLHKETTPEKAELELLKIIPKSYLPAGHHQFILQGRYVCKSLKPNCKECKLQELCPSLKNHSPESC